MSDLPANLKRLARREYITDDPPWHWRDPAETCADTEHIAKTDRRKVSYRGKESAVKRLVSSTELAEIIGVSRATINRLHDAGNIPAPVCIGRIRRWRRDEVDRWIEARCPGRQRWLEMEEHRQ